MARETKRTDRRKAKKRAKTTRKAAPKKTAKRGGRTKRSMKTRSARNSNERIPAEPAGRIGPRRPSNKPRMPGASEPRELAQAEPDARFGDRRQPQANAREHPDGSMPPLERRGYKNTDEGF